MYIIQRPNLLKYRFSLQIYVQTLLYCKVYEIKIERNFYIFLSKEKVLDEISM